MLNFPSSPNDGDIHVDGNERFKWVATHTMWRRLGGGGAVHVGDGAPVAPVAGDRWFISSHGIMATYYDDGDSSQWVSENIQNGPSSGVLSGFKNQLMNGAFDVWQRGAGPFSSADTYIADRWRLFTNTTVTRVDASTVWPTELRSKYALTFSAANHILDQRIENHEQFVPGEQWTISFRKSGTHDSFTPQLFFEGGLGGSLDSWSESDGYWRGVMTVPARPGGETYFTYRFNMNTSEDIHISDVQLEKGADHTAFERRPLQQELTLCERYYYANPQQDYRPHARYNSDASFRRILHFFHPTRMRVNPNCAVNYVSGGTGITVTSENPFGFRFFLTASNANHDILVGDITADAEL